MCRLFFPGAHSRAPHLRQKRPGAHSDMDHPLMIDIRASRLHTLVDRRREEDILAIDRAIDMMYIVHEVFHARDHHDVISRLAPGHDQERHLEDAKAPGVADVGVPATVAMIIAVAVQVGVGVVAAS